MRSDLMMEHLEETLEDDKGHPGRRKTGLWRRRGYSQLGRRKTSWYYFPTVFSSRRSAEASFLMVLWSRVKFITDVQLALSLPHMDRDVSEAVIFTHRRMLQKVRIIPEFKKRLKPNLNVHHCSCSQRKPEQFTTGIAYVMASRIDYRGPRCSAEVADGRDRTEQTEDLRTFPVVTLGHAMFRYEANTKIISTTSGKLSEKHLKNCGDDCFTSDLQQPPHNRSGHLYTRYSIVSLQTQ
ncbi:hypothetical protein T265_04016 [Opisthorchis viverrini]|uniref:Uncharacterized protein n=1 Tax=Opisthorchis viverrini TaxID=6198 RepID=A0A074ZQG8_OPIVI|nr:hypothetical protein T265_04016 [Opisthorchis viverrini]KER29361.1 hypothetical protein T265_04016 [Opisthorchis viverrini]